MKPVICKFGNEKISAVPIRKLPNGNWLMTSMVKHFRFDIGHEIEVPAADILDKLEE